MFDDIIVNDSSPLVVPSNEWNPGTIGCFVIPHDLSTFEPESLELSFERGAESAYEAHVLDQDAFASDVPLVIPQEYNDYGQYCSIAVKFRYDSAGHRLLRSSLADDVLVISHGSSEARMPITTTVYQGLDPIGAAITDEIGNGYRPRTDEKPKSGGAGAVLPPGSPRRRMHDAAKNVAGKAADKAIDKTAGKAADIAISKGLDAAGSATGPVGTVAAKAAKKALENPKTKTKLKGAIKKAAPMSSIKPGMKSEDKRKPGRSAPSRIVRHGMAAVALNPITLGIMTVALPLLLIIGAITLTLALGSSGGSSGSGVAVLNESSAYTPNYTISYTAQDGGATSTTEDDTTNKRTTENEKMAEAFAALSYTTSVNLYDGYARTTAYAKVFDFLGGGWDQGRSCDEGVYTAVRWSGFDVNFPKGLDRQHTYFGTGMKDYAPVKDAPGNGKWEKVGVWDGSEENLQPGDILISSGHIAMFLGKDVVQRVYEDRLKGTDADVKNAAPPENYTWGSAGHHRYMAPCICTQKGPSHGGAAVSKGMYIYRCVKPDNSDKYANVPGVEAIK